MLLELAVVVIRRVVHLLSPLNRKMPYTSTIPGGKTGSVAALTATFATAEALTGGVSRGPTSGSRFSGFAC